MNITRISQEIPANEPTMESILGEYSRVWLAKLSEKPLQTGQKKTSSSGYFCPDNQCQYD